MPITDKTTKLYENLKADNYDVGTMDEFNANLTDVAKRKTLFERMKADNYALDTFEAFDAAIWRPDAAAGIEAAAPVAAAAAPKTLGETLLTAFNNPPTAAQAVAPVYEGLDRAAATVLQTMDNLSTFTSKKTGLPSGGAFGKAADVYRRRADMFAKRGVPVEAGIAYQIAAKTAKVSSMAAVDIAAITATGIVPFMVTSRMGEAAGAAGATTGDVALGAGKGFVEGITLHYVLKGLGLFPRNVRVPAGGVIFGGPAAVAEMQKPEGERDWESVAAQALVGAGLMLPGGKGRPTKEVVAMARERFGTQRMKDAAAKVKAAMEVVEADQKASVAFDDLDKALNSPTANPIDEVTAERKLIQLPEEFQNLPSAQDWADLNPDVPLAKEIKAAATTPAKPKAATKGKTTNEPWLKDAGEVEAAKMQPKKADVIAEVPPKDIDSFRHSLSPKEQAEFAELEDFHYRSVAMQGPEAGYKPYKLTAAEKKRYAELDAKFKDRYRQIGAAAEETAAPTEAAVEAPVAAPSAKQPWEMTREELATKFPKAGDIVDGRKVREDVPNMSSINASVENATILPGIYEVPMSEFTLTGKHYSVEGSNRIDKLSTEIAKNKEITPLIVVVDKDGSYILEGATRADALYKLGAKSFPAKVVLDEGSLQEAAVENTPKTVEKSSVLEAAKQPPLPDAIDDLVSRYIAAGHSAERFPKHKTLRVDGVGMSEKKAVAKMEAELQGEAPAASTVSDLKAEPQFKSVVTNLGKALGETAKGVHEAQGGGRIGILPYSELNYTNARPHFQAAWEHFKASGRDFKAFSEFMMDKYGSDITPYLHRVYADAGNPVVVMTPAGAMITPEAALPTVEASGVNAAANKRTASAVAQQVSRIRKEDWSKLSRTHQENRINKADAILNKERSLTEADTDYRNSILRVLKPKDVAEVDARLRGEAWDKLAADVQRKRIAAAKEAILDPNETPESYVAAINEVRGIADEKFMQQYVGVEYYTTDKPETVIALDVNGNPITAHEMDLLSDLSKADALTRPYAGTSAQFFSEEVPLSATAPFNELVRYPMMENSKRIHLGKHQTLAVDYRAVMKEAKKLGLPKDWRNRIANWGHTFRDASGEEAIKLMGKAPLKTSDMTAGELKLIEFYQAEYKRLHGLSNEAFRLSGLEEMGEAPNYFPAMRSLILEPGQHFSSPEFITKTKAPMPFAKEFTKSKLPLVMDADYIFRTYVTKSLEHIHRTPTHTRIRALLQHTFTDTNGGIVADARSGAPNIVDYASGMIDRASGLRKSLLGLDKWDAGMKIMNTLHRNIIVSTLGYNLQSWAVQPSAVMGTMHKGGAWNSTKAGIEMLFNKSATTQAINESHALAPRFGEFYNAEIGDTFGTKLKRLQTAVAKPGTKPMEWGDYWTAVHSYITGKNKAESLGLTGDAAVRYADDFMLATQSSLDITNRPPMYGTIEGRILGVLSSFSVNDVTRFKREVLGIGANAHMSAAQVAWATWRWMVLATIVNTGYELVGSAFPASGIRRPVPLSFYDIRDGIKNAREQGRSAGRGAAEGVALGLYDLIPFGGPRYDVGGPLGGLQKQIAQTLTGNKQAQPALSTIAKTLGVPAASQATKMWRAIKRKRAAAAKSAAATSRYKRATRSSSSYERNN